MCVTLDHAGGKRVVVTFGVRGRDHDNCHGEVRGIGKERRQKSSEGQSPKTYLGEDGHEQLVLLRFSRMHILLLPMKSIKDGAVLLDTPFSWLRL